MTARTSGPAEAVLAWGGPRLRDLPWRHTRDPWAVLVAEVMAQQTQVDRVLPKYQEWLEKYPSLTALNDWLETRCQELWAEIPHGAQPGTVADAWREEMQHLMQLPRPFDGFVEYAKRVSPTCLIHLERNRYSVPASFANRPVSVRVYPERIVVAAEGQIVCEHRRIFARSHDHKGATVYDWRHYLSVIQRKPGALRNGAPLPNCR